MSSSAADRIVLGIDLGTTNSLVAVTGKNGPIVLRDEHGEALIPSVVTVLAHGKRLVGQAARDKALQMPERTVSSVKRLIGRAGEELEEESRHASYRVVAGDRGLARVLVDDQQYSPEELSADILRSVRERAEAALGQEVKEAVITVPAYFDDGQRQATKDAAELAGLRCLRILNEPTAASLAYGIDGSRDGTVLVYDLGGGTFDVSILKIQDGVFRVLATAGDTHLGGDDFDSLIVEHIQDQLGLREAADLDPRARQAIRRAAENLKFQLTDSDRAGLVVDLGEGRSHEVHLTRSSFETMIEPLVQRTLDCCKRAAKDARLEWSAIDEVVLVGGSTRVPKVRRDLAATVGKEPLTDVDPDLAVALGAAIQADVLAGKNRSLLLLDVIPLSLGLETMGGVVSKLILRNATIPASTTEEFSTQVDNQTGVEINIYQGEREKVEDCRAIGSFRLSGIPPMPAGLPRVAVTFLVDADGVLRVSATEQRSGAAASIQVVPSYGLTREDVHSMMAASIEHAMEDMAVREEIELRNKARAMVRGTRQALELAALPADETYSVRKATDALDQLLQNENSPAPEVAAATEKLSQLTAQIADDVVSSAVAKALREER